ncbi:MAG: hypothetical protein M1812_001284 [Candelaria pacifica]|nr:MAG: hypothetical protein M1812_001284 [Candelaria pacifica]
MSSTPKVSSRRKGQKSRGGGERIPPSQHPILRRNPDSPSPPKKAKLAEVDSPNPKKANRRLKQGLRDLAEIIPRLRDPQQTALRSLENTTLWIEDTKKGNQVLDMELKSHEENLGDLEKALHACERNQALLDDVPATPENPTPWSTAEYSPGRARHLSLAGIIYCNAEPRVGRSSSPEAIYSNRGVNQFPRLSAKQQKLPGMNSSLGSGGPPSMSTPQDDFPNNSKYIAKRASSPMSCKSRAEFKAALIGPDLEDYREKMRLPCEVCDKLTPYRAFHTAIPRLSHNTQQLLVHVEALEKTNAKLHATTDIDFRHYSKSLETHVHQEHRIRRCFLPMLKLSIWNWQLAIDNIQGAIELDWAAGVGKEVDGKRYFGMLTSPAYEYIEGWKPYDVGAIRRSLTEDDMEKLLDWFDCKSEIYEDCLQRLAVLKLPDRGAQIWNGKRFLLIDRNQTQSKSPKKPGKFVSHYYGGIGEGDSSDGSGSASEGKKKSKVEEAEVPSIDVDNWFFSD